MNRALLLKVAAALLALVLGAMMRVPPGQLLGMETSKLQGADVPVTVTGRITDPKVRPDVGVLLGEAVKREAARQLEEKVRKTLQDLLGR